MATDLLSQMAQQYGGTANWNALRGGSDPLLQQFSKQYGADTNWNSFRPAGPPAAGQQPLSTAPATLPQPQQPQQPQIPMPDVRTTGAMPRDPQEGEPPSAPPPPAGAPPPSVPPSQASTSALPPGYDQNSLQAQMVAKYGWDANWNALRGGADPLLQKFAQQYGADTNWNAFKPPQVVTGPAGTGKPATPIAKPTTAATPNPNNPDFNYDYSAHAGKEPWLPNPTYDVSKGQTAYDQYIKQITDSGVSAEDAKATADTVFAQSLQKAMDLANQNAYGGTIKQTDPAYWMEMWKKDPAYTWERLMGRGAGGADAAKYGPWAGGDPNAEGAKNATQYTLGDPLTSPLLAPWDKPFNYADFSSVSYHPIDPFKPPTEADMQIDPGYLSRLHEAQGAIERSASARGTLGTGGTLKDLTQFSQDYAANEYQDLYSRKLNEYLTAYNANLQDFQTLYGTDLNNWLTNYNKSLGEYQQQYNIFENNQAKQFNRLASLSGLGQTAAGYLGGLGSQYGANAGTGLMMNARGLGDYYTAAANARAQQQAQSASMWGSIFGGIGSLFS